MPDHPDGPDRPTGPALPIGPYPHDALRVRDADPASSEVAAAAIAAIRAARPDLAVEHVGSSAVPGLAGKGVIDLVVRADADSIPGIVDDLLAIGLRCQDGLDPWPPTRPMLIGSIAHEGRPYPLHLHVTPDAIEERQLVVLRDALRADPTLRDEYAAVKRAIIEEGTSGPLSYSLRKSRFIRATLERLGVARPPVLPPATIGILGGGQLGRMVASAARAMGYRIAVLDPDPDCPARAVADHLEVGAYDDVDAALRLAARADVVTIELEHIAPAVIDALQAAHVWTLRPGRFAIRMTQDRLAERRFLDGIGAPVAEWREVTTIDELRAAARAMSAREPTAFRLKAAIGGYDGRSQVAIGAPSGDPAVDDAALVAAIGALERSAAAHGLLLEREVDFVAELSVVVGRGVDGVPIPYPVARNVHDAGILVESVVPAPIDPDVAARAQALGARIAVELGLEGVMTAELFLLRDGSLAVNELAPRVHNSGHATIEAARTSQFAQHIRAICGLPLGSGEVHSPAAMVNILGAGPLRPARLLGLERALADPRVAVHLYDKRLVFERRKMGHVTATADTVEEALERARRALAELSWATEVEGDG